jgi:phage portal protein BeeE
LDFFNRLAKKPNPKNAILDTSVLEAGWHTVNQTMNHYVNDKYENGYSSIRAISNRFMTLRPYAIDPNGKPYTTPPNLINVLARPNQDMSGLDFRDTLAVMAMVHDNTYVLVWERVGNEVRPARENIPEERIAGFTFLENVLEITIDDKVQYEVYTSGEKAVYYPYQVIDLHDVNPGNLSKGYSPSKAARRWTRIDDYIADYQSGFFENGAVPAGQFIITAPTAQEYKDIVSNLKKKHKGAGKNNNVTYTYAPLDPTTGKPGQAAITWVPFNTTNKDLALKDIFEQANKKIDSVYGVSAFIRSIDEAPNFATAQVIERNFVENTVRPFALKKWARFQHELNRITGGLGYGITFELHTPHIAEEQKASAETNQIRFTTIKAMIDAGFTYESAVEALDLPNNWKLLKAGDSTDTTINNPKPEVDQGDAVDDSPENNINLKITVESPQAAVETVEKPQAMTTEDMPGFESRLKEPARVLMAKQIEHAIDSLAPENVDPNATKEEKDKFVDEMMVIVSAILLYGGIQQWEAGKNLLREAGVENIPETPYELNDSAITRYKNYLGTVATSYTDDTANAIRAVLERGATEGWSRDVLINNLREINNLDAWRVDRIARAEVNRSGGLSSVEAMRKIQDDVEEVKLEKSMLHTGGDAPCQFCAARLDVWYPVDKVMVEKGSAVTGIDGGTFVNNWTDNEGFDIHPNGHCVPQFRVAS